MIAAYRKSGVSGATDIPPGLLDAFYVEPAFAPEIHREVVEEQPDEKKSAGLYSSEAFTDPDGFTGSYFMSMPVSARAVKSPSTNGVKTGNAFAFDPSIATDWALLMEDEDSDTEDRKSKDYDASRDQSIGENCTLSGGKEDGTPSLLNKVAPPRGLSDSSALPPPPGFPMHNEPASVAISFENKYVKEAGRSALWNEEKPPESESESVVYSPQPVYRHLVLQPRSIPIESLKPTQAPHV